MLQSRGRFYGFKTERTPTGPVRIATPEKAILDSLDRPDLGGGLPEIVKALRKTSLYDPEALMSLAARHPSTALAHRLGYLMSVLGVGDPTSLRRLVRRTGPPVVLDLGRFPEGGGTAVIDPVWRVLDNVGSRT